MQYNQELFVYPFQWFIKIDSVSREPFCYRPKSGCKSIRFPLLFHKFVDGLAKIVDGIFISGCHCIHNAVPHVILQNHLAGIVQSTAYRGQLNQHFRTVVTFFHHPLYLFQMADGPGQTIDNGFLILMDMAMAVGSTFSMLMQMLLHVTLKFRQDIRPFPTHKYIHYTQFPKTPQALPGDIPTKIKTLTYGLFLYIIMQKRQRRIHPMHEHHHHEHHHHHDHDHDHHHHHDHDHGCSGSCQGCASQCEHTPMEELMALMKYMVGHNAAHAKELADLAGQLQQLGNHAAYEQVMAAVSDFEKGNMRLSMVLASVEAK